MTEVFDVVNGFSVQLTAAWTVWLAWGAGLIVWYRRGRTVMVRSLPAPRPRPRRPVKPAAPAEAPPPPQEAPPSMSDAQLPMPSA